MRTTRAGFTVAAVLVAAVAAAGCSRNVVVGSEPSGATGSPENVEAQLQQELSSFATAQKQYYETNQRYAPNVSDLTYVAPADVRIDVIQGDRSGFSAIASRAQSECAVFGGDVRAPRGYVSTAGTPACRE